MCLLGQHKYTCFQIFLFFFTPALNTHISYVLWTFEYSCLFKDHKLKYWTFVFQVLPSNYLLKIPRMTGNKSSCTEKLTILLQMTLTGSHIEVMWKPVHQCVTPDGTYWQKCYTNWLTVSWYLHLWQFWLQYTEPIELTCVKQRLKPFLEPNEINRSK